METWPSPDEHRGQDITVCTVLGLMDGGHSMQTGKQNKKWPEMEGQFCDCRSVQELKASLSFISGENDTQFQQVYWYFYP